MINYPVTQSEYVAGYNASLFECAAEEFIERVTKKHNLKGLLIGLYTDRDGALHVFYRNNCGACVEYVPAYTPNADGSFGFIKPRAVEGAERRTCSNTLTPRYIGTFEHFAHAGLDAASVVRRECRKIEG